MTQYPLSTLPSHKRERSNGTDDDTMSSIDSSLSPTLERELDLGRYGAHSDGGGAHGGGRREDAGGDEEGERRERRGRERFLSPQSATFPPSVPPGGSHSDPSTPNLLDLHQRSIPSPSYPLEFYRRNTPRSVSVPNTRGPNRSLTLSLVHQGSLGTAESDAGYGAGEYAYASASPQPPSLSPMTISTPGFGSGPFEYGSTGSPITPLSPYQFSHSPTVGAGGFGQAQDEYVQSYGLDGMQQQRYRQSPPSSHYVPHPTDPHQHSRTRLKRSHSEHPLNISLDSPTTPSFPCPTDLHAPSRPIDGYMYPYAPRTNLRDPFFGPSTELEAAANAAHAAAAKTGAGTGAFVYKTYHMLLDESSRHLISFNETGTSFIVSNAAAFAREVLPKHFKHNNFSSFVRQLNMYGFHKVNKTPRGQQQRAPDTLGWEFTHPKFVRGNPHQLDDIKRKVTESEVAPAAKMTRSMSANTDSNSPRARLGSFAAGPPTSLGSRGRPSAPTSLAHSPLPHLSHRPFVQPPPPPPPPPNSRPPSHPAHDSPHMRSAHQYAAAYPHARHPLGLEAGSGANVYSSPPVPLPARVEQLEMQRHELLTALAGTQEGYQTLYRQLVETRRRQDVLVDLVGEMHGVLQRTEAAQLPYQFPFHLFAPRPVDDHPSISVTSADSSHPRHQRDLSVPYSHSPPYEPSLGALSFDAAPPQAYREPTYPHRPSTDAPFALPPGFSTYSHSHTTLAPPASPGANFSTAINTPLPPSPHPVERAAEGRAYFEAICAGPELEMAFGEAQGSRLAEVQMGS